MDAPIRSTPDEPRTDALFGAFLETRQRRWPLWPVLIAAMLGFAFFARHRSSGVRVVTQHGFKQLSTGMSTTQVRSLLGAPIATEAGAAGEDCWKYGHPTMDSPSFVLYSVCYQGGKLHDIHERWYQSWSVKPDGTPVPPDADAPAQ